MQIKHKALFLLVDCRNKKSSHFFQFSMIMPSVENWNRINFKVNGAYSPKIKGMRNLILVYHEISFTNIVSLGPRS